jgi:predicted dinucleotide-utilizing enzyme
MARYARLNPENIVAEILVFDGNVEEIDRRYPTTISVNDTVQVGDKHLGGGTFWRETSTARYPEVS